MKAVIQAICPLILAVLVSTVVFLGSILSPSAATAATYYVATTGSDTNPGTQAAPFQTIQKAANVVNPGDTVLVNDGVYTDTTSSGQVVWIQRGGTAGNLITFKSINKWGAKLNGQNNLTKIGIQLDVGYVVVQDFEMYGFGGTVLHIGAAGINVGGSNTQIIGNSIHDIGRYCTDEPYGMVGILSSGSNVTIDRNMIHHVGRYAPGENGCSPSTTIYQNNDHGIYIDGGSTVTIQNTIFYTNNRGWSVHVYPAAVSNLNILNNTFAFPNPYRAGHILLASPITTALIANNIFYQPTTAAIDYFSATLTSVQANNNMTSGGTISTASPPSGITFSGNFDNTNPALVNPSTVPYNLHLQSGSPAIDAGRTLTAVTTDFDGVSRPQGVSYDIGACEYQPTQPTIKAPTNLHIVSP